MTTRLTPAEQQQLRRCEAGIDSRLDQIQAMLRDVRETGMYKENFSTFHEWCQHYARNMDEMGIMIFNAVLRRLGERGIDE